MQTSISSLKPDRIQEHRSETFRLRSDLRISHRDQAVRFVNERGFVFLWPIKGSLLPSLWVAVAGDRPVADAHDDSGHVTWRWKDELLGARLWYYAKLLRRKATFVSMEVAPYFYALSNNYGAPEEDYIEQYREGKLTWEARALFEVLLAEGPMDTISLRRAARMTSRTADSAFNRALETLQADFKILPIGVAKAGAWRYAFVYECVHRHYPALAPRARLIRQAEARTRLAELYLRAVGAAQDRDVTRLFGWQREDVEIALDTLATVGVAIRRATLVGQAGDFTVLASLIAGRR